MRQGLVESVALCALILIASSITLGLYLFGAKSWLVWLPLACGIVLLLLALIGGYGLFKERVKSEKSFFVGMFLPQGV